MGNDRQKSSQHEMSFCHWRVAHDTTGGVMMEIQVSWVVSQQQSSEEVSSTVGSFITEFKLDPLLFGDKNIDFEDNIS